LTIRAFISDIQFSFGSLNICIVDEQPNDRVQILRLGNSSPFAGSWEDVDIRSGEVVEPTLRLPGESGRALLDALAHRYQGGEDTRRLRADYDAALHRADEKDKVIASVVQTLAAKVGPA
jgi:hypothetical protein